MNKGETFYYNESGAHLWVVISDPSSNGGAFVAVNLTSKIHFAGSDCTLTPGEHPWIVSTTYVAYGAAMLIPADKAARLPQLIQSGQIRTHAKMADPVLEKIVAAGKSSKALSAECKAML